MLYICLILRAKVKNALLSALMRDNKFLEDNQVRIGIILKDDTLNKFKLGATSLVKGSYMSCFLSCYRKEKQGGQALKERIKRICLNSPPLFLFNIARWSSGQLVSLINSRSEVRILSSHLTKQIIK